MRHAQAAEHRASRELRSVGRRSVSRRSWRVILCRLRPGDRSCCSSGDVESPAEPELRALDDGHDRGLDAVAVGRPAVARISSSSGSSESWTARPERIAEQLAAELVEELLAALREQVVAQAVDVRRTWSRPSARPGCRWAGRPGRPVRRRPMASNPSRAKPNGSIRSWHLAHDSTLRCFSVICRTVRPPVSSSLSGSCGTFLGGFGQLLAQQHLEQPVAAEDGAGARGARLLREESPPSPGSPPRPCALTPSTRRQSGPVTPGMP